MCDEYVENTNLSLEGICRLNVKSEDGDDDTHVMVKIEAGRAENNEEGRMFFTDGWLDFIAAIDAKATDTLFFNLSLMCSKNNSVVYDVHIRRLKKQKPIGYDISWEFAFLGETYGHEVSIS